jgi:Tol biopolymer transport system component
VNRVVLINSDSKSFETVASGADFYGHPRFSHDGKWISWVQWVHPDMPWTGSELYVAEWKNGKIGKSSHVAGKARTEAVGQPTWHSYGGLMFSSDKTGFHQLYIYDPTSSETRQVPVKGYENADLSISGYSGLGR